MKKVFISFAILFFSITLLFAENSFPKTRLKREFTFEVKAAYQNNSEVIHIKIPHLKPEHVLYIILKSKGKVVLKKKYRGISNRMITLDKNSGVNELTKYMVRLRIKNSKNTKISFTSRPFHILTGKTNKTFFKGKISKKIKRESKRLNNEFLSRNKAVKNLFLNDACSLLEYSPGNDTVYALSNFSRMNHFISIHLHSRRKKILNKFPGIEGLPMEASAIDNKKGRFFFIGHVKKNYFLYVLDIFTGKILKKHKLEDSITLLEFNRTSDKLIGISRISGDSNKLIELNVLSGKIRVIKEIPALSGIPMVPSKMDYKNNKNHFLFFGDMNNQLKLMSANISTGEISFINSYYIKTNSYRIHSFDTNQLIDTIYTTGVQSCTGMVGYNKEYKVGFIVHVSPNVKNIPPVLREIDRGLKKLTGSGLSNPNLRIYIVGGQKTDSDSFNNVITVYRELLQKYHVTYDGAKVYHLGKSYNIIMNPEKIDIF
jgi:hypothetical protein